MRIAMASDHGGFALKQAVAAYLQERGHQVEDFGCHSTESCDYPDFAGAAAKAVASGACERGIVVCSTGIGISIAANKVNGVRAAVCSDVTTAHLVKEHNNANILAFGARIVGTEKAKDMVRAYLEAEFMGGRHAGRVAMLSEIEQRQRKA